MDRLQTQPLDFAGVDERAGFRLHRVEIFNWGTFHEKVWSLHPKGDNALLTGDIGSGKSTLVDAITSLLVPAHKITYNKAAGAESKERTLKSYVLGYYKSERSDTGLAARPVALRDHNSYSVILGHFCNEGFDQQVTLAQVFWIKDGEGQPDRFYVVADAPLTIVEHFAGFGTDINDLKKRLRRAPQVEVHDSFPPYGTAFRRRFGIGNEQAMDLFNQTVSMKSVGNLTDFVRNHTLEPFPMEDRVEALVGHFDDLNRAHEAVLKAKAQIAALEPLVTDCDRHAELAAQAEELRACREALRPWFAKLKGDLLEKRIANLDADLARLASRLETLTDEKRSQQVERDELKRAIAENGGGRIERIGAEIAAKQEEKTRRIGRAEKYNALARALGLPEARDVETFLANGRQLDNAREAARSRQAEVQNAHTEAEVEFRQWKREHDEITAEIVSLRERRSNIDANVLSIRDRLCSELSVDAEGLPFAGELLQVRDDERDWEGAAERLLRSFGLSLLVPDDHYTEVAAWVDRTHLRGRLVYYRVRETRSAGLPSLHPQSLVRKLVIKPDSPFYPWLEAELARRFDHVCCETLEQFQRAKQAITRAGQIKGGEYHEKDDRHRLDDRTRYVLGWSNTAKIAALEKKAADLATRMQATGSRIAALQAERDRLAERLHQLSQLEVFTDFREVDWQPLAIEIEQLEQEKAQLERESDVLRTLVHRLEALESALTETEGALSNTGQEQAVTQNKREVAAQLLDETRTTLAAIPSEISESYFPLLETMQTEALGEHTLTVESCDNRQTDMREWLQARIDAEQKKIDRLRDKIIDAMRAYQNAYPLDTQEVDVAIEAAPAYRQMLTQLQVDDLPRFETHFKQMLNENTIREVANFQAQLNRERQAIRERIETINRSLHAIDYNPGRYIALLAEATPDADIRDFQQELRACTEGALTGSGSEQYTEAKFLEVKAIVERFRGREGTAELDRRWTRKVTDVRNWFVFSASERWREDDNEHEHYSDSGGKSGGQKEKLAYTVLAASLAYQFGLEWGEKRSRSLRFVVIDEAFGRGSDESARYGLELFKRLNLHLLIVTPLQKIHIIEPFVASVGFVHNPDGRQSLLRNLTIEDYQAEKATRSTTR
jgi:uncharacterized protein YPO0396